MVVVDVTVKQQVYMTSLCQILFSSIRQLSKEILFLRMTKPDEHTLHGKDTFLEGGGGGGR